MFIKEIFTFILIKSSLCSKSSESLEIFRTAATNLNLTFERCLVITLDFAGFQEKYSI